PVQHRTLREVDGFQLWQDRPALFRRQRFEHAVFHSYTISSNCKYQTGDAQSVRCRTRSPELRGGPGFISSHISSPSLNAANTLAENSVALARHFLEPLRVDNTNLAPADFDKTRALKKAHCDGDARSSCSEQTSNDIVREQQNVASNRIA